MKRNRVVITGMGVLAPNGIGLDEFWQSILNGRSGIGPITLFDASQFKCRIAGEVKNFDPLDYIEPELRPNRMARQTQLAYAATMMALQDAGLHPDNLELPSPTPVVIGVSMNAMDVLERALAAVRDFGPNRTAPTTVASSTPQAPANVIADRLGGSAGAVTVSAACPSGLDAVADAATMIRSGEAEIAVAGGTDAPITPLAVASFIGSGLISSSDAEPTKASRPFDSLRRSGVLAEGAGVFVLENLERALARGVRAYLEVTGYAKQRDTDTTRPASGLVGSMTLALANSRRVPKDIDYISAYGPSDRTLDAAEVAMIKQAFREHAKSVPVISIKGVTGNPLAAAGPFQIAASALSIRDQVIPPTANYEVQDLDCDLDFIAGRRRKAKVECVLINVRGIGGSASSMIVNRVFSE
jgi:3-oxoacyl-[acyl-carrier-protein] synthase II